MPSPTPPPDTVPDHPLPESPIELFGSPIGTMTDDPKAWDVQYGDLIFSIYQGDDGVWGYWASIDHELGPSRDQLLRKAERVLTQIRNSIPPEGPPCAVCNGTGVDAALDPATLAIAVNEVLARVDEIEAQDRADAEHVSLAIELTYRRLSWMFLHGLPMNDEETRWYNTESVRRVRERKRAPGDPE